MIHATRFIENHEIKLMLIILVVILIAGMSAACQPFETPPIPPTAEPTDFPADFPTPDPKIFDDCISKGGRWEVLGYSGPGCNLPTSDGGKQCRDFRECESACFGDPDQVMIRDEFGNLLPDHEKVEKLNSLEGEKTGLCSPWQESFGCNVWLQQGRFVVICVD